MENWYNKIGLNIQINRQIKTEFNLNINYAK